MLFVIRLGIFTNMNKEIEVYFMLLNVIMNEYCILDILYRVSIIHSWNIYERVISKAKTMIDV